MMNQERGIGLGFNVSLVNQNKIRNSKYIEKDVLDSLVGVWIADQNTNDSPTRNIIKNKLPNKGGDLEILNAAYKGMSGYNGYPVVFGDYETWQHMGNLHIANITNTSINITRIRNGQAIAYSYLYSNGAFTPNNKEFPAFKVKVSNLPQECLLTYQYIGTDKKEKLYLKLTNGINSLPKSEVLTGTPTNDIWVGLIIDAPTFLYDCNITIEILPDYQGAFVTDGVDDYIVSQKSVSDMLEGSDKITVVSMATILTDGLSSTVINTVPITSGITKRNKIVGGIGKTYITGFSTDTLSNNSNITNINKILGDKNDVEASYTNAGNKGLFTPNGVLRETGQMNNQFSFAYYWTVMANKVLTEDQINQVIAYYNLDKYVEPIVYYDVKKQGLTNENHAQFNDKLIDYSGHGRDLQLYNFGWKGNSGVGLTSGEDFTKWHYLSSYLKDITPNKITYDFDYVGNYIGGAAQDFSINAMTVKITGMTAGAELDYYYSKNGKIDAEIITQDGIYKLPASEINADLFNENVGFFTYYMNEDDIITIEQITEYEGALVSDGVDDYGQFVGDLGLKDYTIMADRAYVEKLNKQVPIISSITNFRDTSFIFEHLSDDYVTSFSFGGITNNGTLDINRIKSYQSAYSYNGNIIERGSYTDTGDGLTIGRYGSNTQYSKIALYSLLLFPYSLSKFLLERQLKKKKIGTLYPDMVEFRPVIKSNVPYSVIEIVKINTIPPNELLYLYDADRESFSNNTGIYYPKNSNLVINVKPNSTDTNEVSSITVNGKKLTTSEPNSDGYYSVSFTLDKSPQNIDIIIDEYIRFEDIPQPYPAFVSFHDKNADTSTNVYSWGSKLKIGGLYNIRYNNLFASNPGYSYEDVEVNGLSIKTLGDNPITITKDIVFSTVGKIWIGDNEPACILSPSKLKIPNSSYKILGYIPDISGNGNHGYLYNSAYADGSGVNADGSYQLDGVDDYITFKTLKGGHQVIMKINWTKNDAIIYDQRESEATDNFAIYVPSEGLQNIAYQYRNTGGKTYIDGVLNSKVEATSLKGILHNITITNNVIANPSFKSVIGISVGDNHYAEMSLYDFMLFPEISTDEEIMTINKAIRIEGNVDMSGQGGGNSKKKMNFDEWLVQNSSAVVTPTSFRITSGESWKNIIMTQHVKGKDEYYIESTKIRVTGIKARATQNMAFSHHTGNDPGTFTNFWIDTDGEYTLPQSYVGNGMNSIFKCGGWSGECDILVEIIE